MCIVLDYIQKYPLRTKQILGISYEQYQSLSACAIAPNHETLSFHSKLSVTVSNPNHCVEKESARTSLKTLYIAICKFQDRSIENGQAREFCRPIIGNKYQVQLWLVVEIYRPLLPTAICQLLLIQSAFLSHHHSHKNQDVG